MADFTTKYGIALNVANPDGSSSDEITAVRRSAVRPPSPTLSTFAGLRPEGQWTAGLFETFKPSTWDEIPDVIEGSRRPWVAAYYGLVGIATVTEHVKNPPKTWADLKKPEYKGLVVLNGDPRKSGSALAAVFAAALANGGSFDNAQPGIDYFAELHTNGNLLPTDLSAASLSKGEVSIAIDWTYNMPGRPRS